MLVQFEFLFARNDQLKDTEQWDNLGTVWQDWAIYWTFGKFLKLLETINLPIFLTFLGYICKGVKIYHFSSEIIFGQL